jgi:protocatechuate 3,4-dioxygenase beta subunit
VGGDSSVEVADGEIPEETAGPYPGDGSNGVNVLAESGVVRSDLTSSFGDASGTADGVPVTVRMKVYDLSGEDATPLEGAAIYLWHCDAEGRYSMYSDGAEDENYLRGVQVADAEGRVEFTSIFPGCYAGRWPHMHFEVYESESAATSYTAKMRTSQLALPQETCEEVYADSRYTGSADNLAAISLDSDGIFSDGYSLQMAGVTGSVDEGYVLTLNVPV